MSYFFQIVNIPHSPHPQVIEISGVTDHLLTECDSSDKFAQCPRCKEAVMQADFDSHIAEKKCPRECTASWLVI